MIVLVREGALLLDEVLELSKEPPNFLSRTTSFLTLCSAVLVEIVEVSVSIKSTVFFELMELLVVSFLTFFASKYFKIAFTLFFCSVFLFLGLLLLLFTFLFISGV